MVCRGWARPCLRGATDRKLSDEPAIVEMARSISGLPDDTKMTLVPAGPLTNVTLFSRTYSGRADRIDRIVLMGGTTVGGNATVYAEFNIWDDPEAAQIVVSSGLHIVMCRLDVARHDDGNARYGGLPCVRVVVAIVTEGVFAIHIDFPLLFFDLCHGVEDKTGRET